MVKGIDERTSGGGPTGTGYTGAAGMLVAAVATVRAAVAEVAEVPTFGLPTAELTALMSEVAAATNSMTELQARLVTEADTREAARDAGCTSTFAWLRQTLHLSGAAAGRMAGTAKALTGERVEAVRAAWAQGQLTAEQAQVIFDAIHTLSPDLPDGAVRAGVVDLIDQAGRLSFDELRRVANRLIEVIDPDAADRILADQLDAEEKRALQHARLRFSRRGDGTTGISGRLPDLQAAMFKKALDAYAAPRRASAQDGGTPAPGEEGPVSSPVLNPDGDHTYTEIGLLSYPQRLGRALMELIEHLPTDRLPQSGGAHATIIATLNLDQLISGLGNAVLDTGGPISAGEARRLACNATIVPMVLDGKSRILDLGMGMRLFDRYQRLALAVRDGGCVWRGCSRPPAWCEAHHIKPWKQGGPTDLSNGTLVCGFHHRLLHAGEWEAKMAPDGIVDIIPPARVDPDRRPMRHERSIPRPPPERQPC